MSFRIKAIGIYSRRSGELRTLDFDPQGLNIITGHSQTGKSSILEIIDYCLLTKRSAIPKGVVRDSVSHVAALLECDDECLVVLRALPEQGTSQELLIESGYNLGLPAIPSTGRWNLRTARNRISAFAGIESLPLLTNDRDSDAESQHPANIRHCAPFLFQPQDVIGSRAVSFAGLADPWVKRHVIDALDYFLQIVTIETLRDQRELRRLEKEKRKLERKIREQQKLGADGWERGRALLARAVALGMVTAAEPRSLEELKVTLKAACDKPTESLEAVTSSLNLEATVAAERALRTKRFQLDRQIGEIERYLREEKMHAKITDKQITRITIRDLLPKAHDEDCPVCGNELDAEDIEQQLSDALMKLSGSQHVPTRLRSKLEAELERLKTDRGQVASQLKDAQQRARSLFEYLGQRRNILEEVVARQRLAGRIIEYLKSVESLRTTALGVAPELLERIRKLEAGLQRVDRLRKKVSNEITERITEQCQQLDVEFPESPARINLKSLALEVRLGSEWVRLEELGSGANWVSYHVAGAIGLAKTFVHQDAPVPRFLMLDQPSQAWFPPEVALRSGRDTPESDKDRRSVRRLYKLLKRASSGEDGIQLIIADHARIREDWFMESVVADWHDEGALVPRNW